MRAILLGTGTAELVYEDPDDVLWGIDQRGRGGNELGKALERVRDRLRAESESADRVAAEIRERTS